MRKKVEPQERRWRAYLLTERLREQAANTFDPEPYLAQAAAIEADYGGWTETDMSPPVNVVPVYCPACGQVHNMDFQCRELRDAFWALLKDKGVKDNIKQYVRFALGLDDAPSKPDLPRRVLLPRTCPACKQQHPALTTCAQGWRPYNSDL